LPPRSPGSPARIPYFFDAISPIVEADTIDLSKVFRASRYGKGARTTSTARSARSQYDRFHAALLGAAERRRHEFEKEIVYFEGCLPIEEMARRGRETWRSDR